MKKFILAPVLLWSLTLLGHTSHEFTSLSEAFASPEEVKVLSLQDQDLTELPDSMIRLTNLQVLDISFNRFKEVPQVVFELPNLRELHMRGAYSYIDQSGDRYEYLLESVPAGISALENLRVLDLSLNNLTELPKELGELPNLRRLHLWHNALDQEDLQVICNATELRFLDIGGNDIDALPKEMAQLKNLRTLYLDNAYSEGAPTGTSLQHFPTVLSKLPKLHSLSLSGQEIDRIPKEIGRMGGLEYLNLFGNTFASLPKEIGKLENLEELNIDVICLGYMTTLCEQPFSFPSTMNKLTHLKVLDFDSRQVSPEEINKLKNVLPIWGALH